uniref:SSD domain-containing protein n=1 Tax=Steinernema glaseri TaxID=37863 RepID=A0A1I7YH77_9BILA
MLTLIEPPGAKRGVVTGATRNSRSAQHLLNLAIKEDDFIDEEFIRLRNPGGVECLDRLLIGNSDSADYSERWKREFAQRPTWCDADMTLQQIQRGKAVGNKAALYSRSFIQRCLFWLGCFVQKHSLLVIAFIMVLFSFSCYGLQFVKIETDIVKLWVAKGGRLDAELTYLSDMEEKYGNTNWTESDELHWIREQTDEKLANLAQEKPSEGGYQVVIQTKETDEDDILTKKGLLRHVDLISEIAGFSVNIDGFNWTLRDICFKPGGIDPSKLSSHLRDYASTLERLMPCVWITPIDCFWEGAKAIGPDPPITIEELGALALFLETAHDLPVSWSSFNPEQVVNLVRDIDPDISTLISSFENSGIGVGYINRTCIDPYDPDCPPTAPNGFDYCKHFVDYKAYLNSTGQTFNLQPDDESLQNDEFNDGSCSYYRRSFITLLRNNKSLALQFMTEDELPKLPDYGMLMKGGCEGFARNILKWPRDMIIGGAKSKNGGNSSITADALQTVFLVASSEDVYKRFKDPSSRLFSALNDPDYLWNVKKAEEIILTWQRAFTKKIYNHPLNFLKNTSSVQDGEARDHRIVHPLASTSMADMLEEFCQFNYAVIFVGYFLMLMYAIYSQMKRDGCCLLSINSSMGLGFAGVLTVTYASISGLGLATWLGIEFNAATTQIVPFLTLGIGVDNMFMLLHNYHEVTSNVKKNEIGVLMKETGMSILMTSINNILSFLTGTLLPIPALRSFCAQSSILLTFNLIAIMTAYPAMIALDLRRRKKLKRDLCCWLTSDENIDDEENGFATSPTLLKPHVYEKAGSADTPSYHGLISINGVDDDEENDVRPWTLHAFLRNYYVPFIKWRVTKVVILVLCSVMFVCGLWGIRRSTMGLELSDVLPEHTAPAAFLKARDKYFSFYPMHIVLRSENFDISEKQGLVDRLHAAVGRSKYVVKLDDGKPSEKYWLELFRDWLTRLQRKFYKFRNSSTNITVDIRNEDTDVKIAYSLMCSHGEVHDCSRAEWLDLIDDVGIINVDGFYNYLHAWHEYENMLYAVSQATFYPEPRKLRQGLEDKYLYYVPPAKKIVYSQIPYYLSGLTDTPVIVDMIKEIRSICEEYQLLGIDSFPHGIAFTFWEQYLHLNENLINAIGVIALAVFCVISFLLFNPWAASCIMVILVLMTVELAGFLGFVGIKLNPVSAVTLITAVGIGVEFTAHVVFAFLTSLGDRNERMAAAIDRVFVPVIHGALSTLLGIIMLAFSEFEFVVKYFFVVMFALIIIGLINGLALLPVLLSLIGPSCEIRPCDGNKKRLSVPPSLRERSKGMMGRR